MVDIEYQLLEAARSGDLDMVVKILSQRPDIVNCRENFMSIHYFQRDVRIIA